MWLAEGKVERVHFVNLIERLVTSVNCIKSICVP